jgi:hypothetical protein
MGFLLAVLGACAAEPTPDAEWEIIAVCRGASLESARALVASDET